jgi:hypothetical protein
MLCLASPRYATPALLCHAQISRALRSILATDLTSTSSEALAADRCRGFFITRDFNRDALTLRSGDGWAIAGTLLAADGGPLDLRDMTVAWTLLGFDGRPVLTGADATVTLVDAEGSSISITVPAAVTAALPPGRYHDALRVSSPDLDLADLMWIGVVLCAANPFG